MTTWQTLIDARPPSLKMYLRRTKEEERAAFFAYVRISSSAPSKIKHNTWSGRTGIAEAQRRYNALFTEKEVRKILRMYIPGKKKGSFGCRRIAKLYGVWPQVITDIVRRITWKHVTKE